MLTFNLDEKIKLEYNGQSNKIGFQKNEIGPTTGIDISEPTTFTPADSNSMYVSDTVGNDTTGDGTSALPYKTLLKGATEATALRPYVVVLDSVTYNESLITLDNSLFAGFFADTGETPKYTTRLLGYTPTDANSIFFDKTGTALGTGTQADPVLTIAQAVALTDATHQKIVCQDSGTYSEPGIEFTGNFLGLYSALGFEPTFKPQSDENLSDYTVSSLGSAIEYMTGTPSTSANYQEQTRATKLTNGNVVISYVVSGGTGYYKIVDSTGGDVKAETSLGSNILDISPLALSNGNFSLSYRKASVSNQGHYTVLSSTGSVVVAETQFATEAHLMDTSLLNNGNWVIGYVVNGVYGPGNFVILEQDGTVVKSATQFTTGVFSVSLSVATLNNGDFVIAFSDGATSNHGSFVIYDENGLVSKATTVHDATAINTTDVRVLSNTDFMINYTISGDLYFIIYNEAGTVVEKAKTTVETTDNVSAHAGVILNDNSFLLQWNLFSAQAYYYTIYSEDGSTIHKSKTLFRTNSTSYYTGGNPQVFSEGKVILFCEKHFYLLQPYTYSGLKVSADSIINGFILDANDEGLMTKLIGGNSGKITITNCDVKECSNPADATVIGWGINSDDDLDIDYCRFFNNDGGIKTVSSSVLIKNSLLYNNDEDYAIDIDGAGSGIELQHLSIFSNKNSIRLRNNNGSEVIKNNILHDNSNGAELDTSVTHTNSTNTDTNTNLADGSQVVSANPLFINEGASDVTAIDLNIKVKILGYSTNSPALELADDAITRNAGGWDVIYVGSPTTYTSILVAKPFIDPKVIPIKKAFNIARDGSPKSSKVSQSLRLILKWEGLLRAEADNLEDLYCSKSSDVRIYLQPTTYPSSFAVYKLDYNEFTEGIRIPSQGDLGIDTLTMIFYRGYERP